ncbi:hypothetical protein R3P38DRAFT_3173028 [Favolaschia claudopus]|uniref:Uncharacterized protein n=1 Tax=Favolaschia claudopus TaxID=2862362 RepID=A0AAW0DPG2_9AGAR
MPDPVYDASNPHPVINRKNSTRSGDASQPPSNTTKRNTTAVPSTSKTSSGAPKPAAPGRKPPSQAAASPRPSPAATSQTLGSRVASPTTASAARDVHAPAPRLAPFGTAAPRLPSHMFDQQTRGPPAARTDVSQSGRSDNELFLSATSGPPFGGEVGPASAFGPHEGPARRAQQLRYAQNNVHWIIQQCT